MEQVQLVLKPKILTVKRKDTESHSCPLPKLLDQQFLGQPSLYCDTAHRSSSQGPCQQFMASNTTEATVALSVIRCLPSQIFVPVLSRTGAALSNYYCIQAGIHPLTLCKATACSVGLLESTAAKQHRLQYSCFWIPSPTQGIGFCRGGLYPFHLPPGPVFSMSPPLPLQNLSFTSCLPMWCEHTLWHICNSHHGGLQDRVSQVFGCYWDRTELYPLNHAQICNPLNWCTPQMFIHDRGVDYAVESMFFEPYQYQQIIISMLVTIMIVYFRIIQQYRNCPLQMNQL